LVTSSKRLRSTSEKIFLFLSNRTHETGPAQVNSGLLAPVPALQGLGSHHTALLLDARSFSPLIANRAGRLVLETLDPLPGDRKCFRLINGVLVERTVKDVVPALRTNAEGLKKVLDDLVKQYKTKQDELEKWKVWTNCHACAVIPPCLTPSAEEEQCPGCAVMKVCRVPDRSQVFKKFPTMPCHQASRVWSACADRAEETAGIQDTPCTDVLMGPSTSRRGRGQSKGCPSGRAREEDPNSRGSAKVHLALEADGT
jgi:hypothetical protein